MNPRHSSRKLFTAVAPLAAAVAFAGCVHISAVRLSPSDHPEPEGIPYYLPRAYIVVTKNVRYIPTPTVGLTMTAVIPNSFEPEPGSGGGGAGGGSGGGWGGGSGGSGGAFGGSGGSGGSGGGSDGGTNGGASGGASGG